MQEVSQFVNILILQGKECLNLVSLARLIYASNGIFYYEFNLNNHGKEDVSNDLLYNLQYGILATHNHESINFAKTLYTIKNRYLFANLKGMNEQFMDSIDVQNKAVYLPYGPYIKMIPYLSRRLYENLESIKYITK